MQFCLLLFISDVGGNSIFAVWQTVFPHQRKSVSDKVKSGLFIMSAHKRCFERISFVVVISSLDGKNSEVDSCKNS